MLECFERVGYSAEIAGLEREFGRTLTKLPDWARRPARLLPAPSATARQRQERGSPRQNTSAQIETLWSPEEGNPVLLHVFLEVQNPSRNS